MFTDVKVSIIVPVFNVEKYLAECLNSLLHQTLREIEIICVDDCSTDNSAQIMREYALRDDRIKNIFLTVNNGPSKVRNIALQNLNGQFICFVDSDDMLELNALEKLYDIANGHNLDVLRFLPSIIATAENKKESERFGRYYKNHPVKLQMQTFSGITLLNELLHSQPFITSTCVNFVKSDFLRKHNIAFPEGCIHEDNYFSVKCLALAENAMVINDHLYIRRLRPNSIMTDKEEGVAFRHVSGYLTVIKMFQQEINAGIYSPDQENAIQFFCADLLAQMINIYGKDLTEEDHKKIGAIFSEAVYSQSWFYIFSAIISRTDYNKIKSDLQKQNTTNKKLKAEINKLKNSRSYRWGRKLTWLPRKIRQFFK